MAQPLTTFLNQKCKLAELFSTAEKYGLNIGDCDSYPHHVCQEMINILPSKHFSKQIEVVETTFVYSEIIRHMEGNGPFIPVEAGQSECKTKKNGTYIGFLWMSLFDCLDYMISMKKIIFLRIGIHDYGADKFKDKKSEMIAHGTVAILIPNGNTYKMFYINSHGQDMVTTNFYDFPLTRTRDRHITLNESVDTHIMKFLVEKYNERLVYRIEFNGDKQDTYLGANLQSGDGHGLCYLFPYIIWYYFCKNYNKTREINEVTIPSVRKMLLSGNINRFIHSCFTDFDDKFADKFVENIREFRSKQKCIDTLENIIIKGDTRFIKKIGNATIGYLTQAYFTKKIKNI